MTKRGGLAHPCLKPPPKWLPHLSRFSKGGRHGLQHVHTHYTCEAIVLISRTSLAFCLGWCREGELNPHSAKHRRILSPRIQLRRSAANYAGVRPTRGRRIFDCAQLRSGAPECDRLPSPGRHTSEMYSIRIALNDQSIPERAACSPP